MATCNADRNPKAATAVNAIFLQRHLHPLSLYYYLRYLVLIMLWHDLSWPCHLIFKYCQNTPPLFSPPLPNSLCVSFNAIYYLKLNIHRTLEQNFVHRLNFLTVASDAVNRKKVGKYRKGMGVVRGWGGCLQDTTRTGLKIATPNWVFKFSNIISRQIDKFSFAPSLCANFSASNWVISLQSSIEIYYMYILYTRYIYVCVCLLEVSC